MRTRWLFVAVALALNSACGAGAHDVEVRAANDAAVLANDASAIVLGEYRRQQDAAIESATSRDDAQAKARAIRDRWSPVWAAWEVLRGMHDAWTVAITSGGPVPVDLSERVRVAYCDLRAHLDAGAKAKLKDAGCER